MIIKTKSIILVGISLALIHILLLAINYPTILEDAIGVEYLGVFSLFFVFWGCMHLFVGRLYHMNQQTLSGAGNNPMMTRYIKLKQYYKSALSKEELTENISFHTQRKGCRYQVQNEDILMISNETKSGYATTHVGIRLFPDGSGTTIATEVLVDINEYVSKTKLFFAGLLFISTFFGMIAVAFAFAIHLISMYEMMDVQKSTKTHLNLTNEIIQESMNNSSY